MFLHARRTILLATAIASVWCMACSRSADPRTPDDAKRRGEELIAQTSATLRAASAMTFETSEMHQRVRRNGEKHDVWVTRQVKVRRPDRLAFHITGSGDRDVLAVYDGRSVTLVGNTQKVFARVEAPPTIDAMLDRVSERYDVPMPMADFLYSNPQDSFTGGEFTGGWVKRTDVENQVCHELHYTGKAADFTLWVSSDARALPCKVNIVYKTRPGQPTSTLTFRNWNLSPTLADSEFAATVPAGYEQIPIVERIPRDDLKADPAKAMGVAAKTK